MSTTEPSPTRATASATAATTTPSPTSSSSSNKMQPITYVIIPLVTLASVFLVALFAWFRRRRSLRLGLDEENSTGGNQMAERQNAGGRYDGNERWPQAGLGFNWWFLRSNEGLNELGEAPPPYDVKKRRKATTEGSARATDEDDDAEGRDTEDDEDMNDDESRLSGESIRDAPRQSREETTRNTHEARRSTEETRRSADEARRSTEETRRSADETRQSTEEMMRSTSHEARRSTEEATRPRAEENRCSTQEPRPSSEQIEAAEAATQDPTTTTTTTSSEQLPPSPTTDTSSVDESPRDSPSPSPEPQDPNPNALESDDEYSYHPRYGRRRRQTREQINAIMETRRLRNQLRREQRQAAAAAAAPHPSSSSDDPGEGERTDICNTEFFRTPGSPSPVDDSRQRRIDRLNRRLRRLGYTPADDAANNNTSSYGFQLRDMEDGASPPDYERAPEVPVPPPAQLPPPLEADAPPPYPTPPPRPREDTINMFDRPGGGPPMVRQTRNEHWPHHNYLFMPPMEHDYLVTSLSASLDMPRHLHSRF